MAVLDYVNAVFQVLAGKRKQPFWNVFGKHDLTRDFVFTFKQSSTL
jgi:hypothetical protein